MDIQETEQQKPQIHRKHKIAGALTVFAGATITTALACSLAFHINGCRTIDNVSALQCNNSYSDIRGGEIQHHVGNQWRDIVSYNFKVNPFNGYAHAGIAVNLDAGLGDIGPEFKADTIFSNWKPYSFEIRSEP